MKINNIITYLKDLEKKIPLLENKPELILEIFKTDDIDEITISKILYSDFEEYSGDEISDLIKNNLKKIKAFENFNILMHVNNIKLTSKHINNCEIINIKYSLLSDCIDINIFNHTFFDNSQYFLNELKNILKEKPKENIKLNLKNHELKKSVEWYKHTLPYFEKFLNSKKTLSDKYFFAKNVSSYFYYGYYNKPIKYSFFDIFFANIKNIKNKYIEIYEKINDFDEELNEKNQNLLKEQKWINENYKIIENDFKNIIKYLIKIGYTRRQND